MEPRIYVLFIFILDDDCKIVINRTLMIKEALLCSVKLGSIQCGSLRNGKR